MGVRKLVCFSLAGQEYAAPIEDVKETITPRPISRVFLTPPWVGQAAGELVHFLRGAQEPTTIRSPGSRLTHTPA